MVPTSAREVKDEQRQQLINNLYRQIDQLARQEAEHRGQTLELENANMRLQFDLTAY